MFMNNNVRPGQPLTSSARLTFGKVAPYRILIGLLFVVAVLAFEVFNFDTTKYALGSFLGGVSFGGLRWSTILAVAFCAIDFAGLLRIFIPDDGNGAPKEVWYLMGAWLLGATLNALMTWWAVSLTLLNQDIGNEVLSRSQLLYAVPVFVASLVWLTRILFIGSLSVASSYLAEQADEAAVPTHRPQRAPQHAPQHAPQRTPQRAPQPSQPFRPLTDQVPAFLEEDEVDEAPAAWPRPQRIGPNPRPISAGARSEGVKLQ